MTTYSSEIQCNTNPVFHPATLIQTVPVPETPAQVCALFGFTCLANHNRKMHIPLEKNPILKEIIEHGRFPSDGIIRKLLPRPFLILEGNSHRECTMEEMDYYWEVRHQDEQEEATPVSIVEVTKLGLVDTWRYHFGKPINSKVLHDPSWSCVIFNHLGYPIEVGMKVFVHNNEIAKIVPPDFSL